MKYRSIKEYQCVPKEIGADSIFNTHNVKFDIAWE